MSMVGHPGPYVEESGPRIWVPRTIPYLEARRVAKEAIQDPDLRLRYVGKAEGFLYGFTRDCDCDAYCVLTEPEDNPEGLDEDTCLVPVWAFESVEVYG